MRSTLTRCGAATMARSWLMVTPPLLHLLLGEDCVLVLLREGGLHAGKVFLLLEEEVLHILVVKLLRGTRGLETL